MKRYIVFVFNPSAPRGGWADVLQEPGANYAVSFETAEEAAQAGKRWSGINGRMQVVDMETGEITLEFSFSAGEWTAV